MTTLDLSSTFYKLASVRIIHETIGEDTLIINLDNGNYYSLKIVASSIWNYLLIGKSLAETANLITQTYEVGEQSIISDLVSFISTLDAECLIISDPDASEVGNKFEDAKKAIEISPKYQPPLLEKYTDMETLLLADPIHEFLDEKK